VSPGSCGGGRPQCPYVVIRMPKTNQRRMDKLLGLDIWADVDAHAEITALRKN
jgi:hypothetical protein